MLTLTKLLLFAQICDVLTYTIFYALIGPGQFVERNPIILALMTVGGIYLVIVLKIGLPLSIVMRAHKYVYHTRLITFFIAAGIAAGVVGAGFNMSSIIRSI